MTLNSGSKPRLSATQGQQLRDTAFGPAKEAVGETKTGMAAAGLSGAIGEAKDVILPPERAPLGDMYADEIYAHLREKEVSVNYVLGLVSSS